MDTGNGLQSRVCGFDSRYPFERKRLTDREQLIAIIQERERRAVARTKEIFPGWPEADIARIKRESHMSNLPKSDCTKSPYCRSKVWVIGDETFSLSKNFKELVPHVCRNAQQSEFPADIYVGVWKRGDRIRYTGPFKKENAARRPPDANHRWTLVNIQYASPTYTALEDNTTIIPTISYEEQYRRRY